MPESDNSYCADEPTEMTAMTGGSQSEAVAGPPTSIMTQTSRTASRSCEPFQKAWLKRQLRTPAGRCVFLLAFLGFTILISYLVTKIVIGVMYLSHCPLERFIPFYLVLSSILMLLFITLLIFLIIKYHGQTFDDDKVSPIHLIALVYYFVHLVLQLAGSVCVIRTYNQVGSDQTEESGTFERAVTPGTSGTCDATLITFAFGVVVFELVLSGICLLLTVLTLIEVIYFVCFKQQ